MARVLVVEDSDAVRMAVTDVLELAGHCVTEAANGREAVDYMRREYFELVITDVLMPELDGVEVIKAVRQLHPSTRVIAMSGGAPNLPAGYALKMVEMFAADAVLYKPFLNAELEETVGRLLNTLPTS